ncbi:MAG: rhomboid family intramembrane serine protease [Candidatus Pacebacteria bacterium]|nr:rhomboid family intramembrane serine protease [Candidatus Paceibacterota bacterium]
MFPLYDESTQGTKKPFLVIALIIINVLFFLITSFVLNFEDAIFEWGLIPAKILNGQSFVTFLSSMFLHANFLHLAGNMWFLWLFGDNLEQNLGSIKFFGFYILTGIAASLAHIYTSSSLDLFLPVIGASGAISGVLGAYVVLFPKNKIKAFMIGYLRPYFFSIPAWFYALIWFGYQLIYATGESSIAYMAHIGGFLSGAILIFVFGKKVKSKNYNA